MVTFQPVAFRLSDNPRARPCTCVRVNSKRLPGEGQIARIVIKGLHAFPRSREKKKNKRKSKEKCRQIRAASPGSQNGQRHSTQSITNNHLLTPLGYTFRSHANLANRGQLGVKVSEASVSSAHAPYAAPIGARRSYWACVLAETNSNARLLQPSQSSLQLRTFPPWRNY